MFKNISFFFATLNKLMILDIEWGFPGGASGTELACQSNRHRSCWFSPQVRKISWRRKWQPAPVFLPGESHRQRSLVGYSPWGH